MIAAPLPCCGLTSLLLPSPAAGPRVCPGQPEGLALTAPDVIDVIDDEADGAAQCQRLCIGNPTCKFFNYLTNSYAPAGWATKCVLKTEESVIGPAYGQIMGPRICSYNP